MPKRALKTKYGGATSNLQRPVPLALLPIVLVVICLLTMVVFATRRAEQRQRTSRTAVLRSHEVAEKIQQTFTSVEDAETGQRGYLLTGSPDYLEPFLQGSRNAPLDLNRLQSLTHDDPVQQSHIERLRPLIQGKLAELQQTVVLYQEGRTNTGLRIVHSNKGEQLMENIRNEVFQMQTVQSQELSAQTAAMEMSARQTSIWVSWMLALAVVLFCLAAWAVASLLVRQAKSEERIQDFNLVLEFQKCELEKANAELEALATTDMLTGLRNRRAFDLRLAEEFGRASRYDPSLSLILLDIDSFKQYNDAFGHLAGDEVLRKMGKVLQTEVRETDFLARYGGEEIAIILPETDENGALQLAERVRAAVATAVWEHRAVTASFGVSTLWLGLDCPAEMLAAADRALYQSKACGRNCVTHVRTADTFVRSG